jgi:hypothetical protein
MANHITPEQMDELKLTPKEKQEFKYYTYSSVKSIKGIANLSDEDLLILLRCFKNLVIRKSIDYKNAAPVLDKIAERDPKSKHQPYGNENWWAGVIFEECEKRTLNGSDVDEFDIPEAWMYAIR